MSQADVHFCASLPSTVREMVHFSSSQTTSKTCALLLNEKSVSIDLLSGEGLNVEENLTLPQASI
jgi:hypothetical protein